MTHSTPPQTIDTPHARSPRRRRTRTLLAATLVAGALGLAACSSSGSSTPTTAAPATATTGSAGTTGTTGTTGTDAITIKNFSFAPTSITVAPGTSVTVTNKDQVAHTVTSSKGGFDTGDIQPGQSKTITAPKTPGSYPYICSIHQYMTGTLVVSG